MKQKTECTLMLNINERKQWQLQFLFYFVNQVLQHTETGLANIMSATLFMSRKLCCIPCPINSQFLWMTNSLNNSTFMYHAIFLCVICVCPSWFALIVICGKTDFTSYVREHLSVEFFTFEANLGGYTLCPEIPCGLEIVVEKSVTLLYCTVVFCMCQLWCL